MARFISRTSGIGRAFSFRKRVSITIPVTTPPPTTTPAPPPPQPTNLVIFNDTLSANNSITGGWTTFITGGYGSPDFEVRSDGIRLRAPWWQDAVAETVNNINLTGATSITIKVSSSTGQPWYYYAGFSWPNTSGGHSGYQVANPSDYNYSNREITIPVSDAGNGKIRLNVTNSESGSLILHSVVVNY